MLCTQRDDFHSGVCFSTDVVNLVKPGKSFECTDWATWAIIFSLLYNKYVWITGRFFYRYSKKTKYVLVELLGGMPVLSDGYAIN